MYHALDPEVQAQRLPLRKGFGRMPRKVRSLASLAVLTLVLFAPGSVSVSVSASGAAAPRADVLVGQDQSVAAGIYEITRSWSANVEDFTNDGWPDLLLSRHGNPARLYRNDAGRFAEIYPGKLGRKDRHDCAWGDVNNDGLSDAYCTIGAEHGFGVKGNELWIQRAKGNFANKAASFGVTDDYGRSRHTTFIDVNHDAYIDLFVGNKHPRQDGIPTSNRLFINRGTGAFRSAPEFGLDEKVGGGEDCAQAMDFNNDGWEDLLYCGKDGLALYRNEQGAVFSNVTAALGVYASMKSAALVDLDGDGWLDLAAIEASRLAVQYQRGGLFAAPVTIRSLTQGFRVGVGDINADSRPDLYIVQTCDRGLVNLPDLMLLNKPSVPLGFVDVPMPQADSGCGQDATSIDSDLDGRDEFIVLNGGGWQLEETKVVGPVQLIGFRPAA